MKPPAPAVGKMARGSLHCSVNEVLFPSTTSNVVSPLGAMATVLVGLTEQPVNEPVLPSGPVPVPTASTRAECVWPRFPAEE